MDKKLDKLREMYLEYTFLCPQVPRPERIFDNVETVVNKAEDELYIDLTGRNNTKGIKDIIPGFDIDDYSFIQYSYVQHNGTQEGLLSLSPINKKNIDIELGKIKRKNIVSYQIKIGENPVEIFAGKNNLPTHIRQNINFLEQVEAYLRKEIPKYFKLQSQPVNLK